MDRGKPAGLCGRLSAADREKGLRIPARKESDGHLKVVAFSGLCARQKPA